MHRFLMMAVVGMMLGFAPGEASGQTLTVSGTCPGVMTFTVTGATPNSRIAFLHAQNTGSFVIPGSFPCGGTVTGLSAPVIVGAVGLSDGFGNMSVSAAIPAVWCGNRNVQVIDLFPCIMSNVVLVI